MGAMHTWLWGERYPEMMDCLVPIVGFQWKQADAIACGAT
jgi:homoserine acetyltransferase